MHKTDLKIAIYTDSLLGMGGGSKVALMMADMLNADIVTCEFEENLKSWVPVKTNVVTTGSFFRNISQPVFYFFESPLRFLMMKNKYYDVNIFLGISSIFAARNTKNNIWFCYTPNRLIYDLKQWKLDRSSFFKKVFFYLHIAFFQFVDQWIVRNKMDYIISQTETVKDRVFKYYQRNSQINYSPVDVNRYRYTKNSDYYLTSSRLVEEKRVDLIVKAFNKMPEKRLVIVGQGPEKEKLIKLKGDNKNISILGGVDEEELIDLYANCFATIYLPKDEDFGLIPVESNASGKPCIAANEGGCKETIINNKTGFLISPSVDAIVEIVNNLTLTKVKSMKKDCLYQAKRFDISVFRDKWIKFINLNYRTNLF